MIAQIRCDLRLKLLDVALRHGHNMTNPEPLQQFIDSMEELVLGPLLEDLKAETARGRKRSSGNPNSGAKSAS